VVVAGCGPGVLAAQRHPSLDQVPVYRGSGSVTFFPAFAKMPAMTRIFNITRKVILAETMIEARGFFSRLRGALGRPSPTPGWGLYLSPCAWVHTLGMRFPIDAVYIGRGGRVLAVTSLAPWRVGPRVPAAIGVLELPAGACAHSACLPGDQLEFQGGAW
jgi:uncharacterized protein